MKKNSHCSHCGGQYNNQEAPFPRSCGNCNNITFLNPIPVVVALVPVWAAGRAGKYYGKTGLLLIKRATKPIGKWALPGGFLDWGETWEHGVARELYEEVGILFPSERIELYDVISTPNNHTVIFGMCPVIDYANLLPFEPNEEVMEIMAAEEPPDDIAFPSHEQMIRNYLNR